MAHTSLSFNSQNKAEAQALAERKALDLEKAGVILGFLLGMVLAVGPMYEHLLALGVPHWFTLPLGVAVVAASSQAGLRLARAVGRALGWTFPAP